MGKLIVDGVVASIQSGQNAEQVRKVFIYLLLELVLFLLSAAFNHGRRLIQQLIQLPSPIEFAGENHRQSADPLDLAYFEDADFYDRLQNSPTASA